jgi:hypothetical protein
MFAVGCGPRQVPKAQAVRNRDHFERTLLPRLEADLAEICPGFGDVEWGDVKGSTQYNHTETFPAPPPRATAFSARREGKAGEFKVSLSAVYRLDSEYPSSRSISISRGGEWRKGDFPRNALEEAGFAPEVVASLSPFNKGKWTGSHGGRSFEVRWGTVQMTNSEGVDSPDLKVLTYSFVATTTGEE